MQSSSENKDGISNLPAELLCYILSFLPIGFTARTCVLSRRWRYLWTLTSSPILQLNDVMSANHFCESCEWEKFVDRFLASRKECIRKFTLVLHNRHSPSLVDKWVLAAITHNLEELELFASRQNARIYLPPIVFSCVNLVVLKLEGNIKFEVPKSVCFMHLKVLELNNLTCLDDVGVRNILSGSSVVGVHNILSGSPVLEELVIHKRDSNRRRSLCLNSSTLKKLAIYIVFDEKDSVSRLSQNRMMNHSAELHCNLPYFRNLIHLEVTSGTVVLNDMLVASPVLKVLVFYGRADQWDPPESVPHCFNKSLEVVDFDGFNGGAVHMKMVEYFLQNALALKKMRILCRFFDIKESKSILAMVSKFPRASHECQISII